MSKKNLEERKRDNHHLKIIFSVLIMVLSFLAELYIMIIRNGDPIYLAIFGLVFLFFSYILMNSIMQIQYMQAKIEKEDHEALQKSEKASYLIIKKSFEEIFQRLDSLEKEIQLPTEELITAQKAIAKVNISRSKENTDALMNSNDQLLEKVMEFEEILDNNNQKIINSQSQNMEQQIQNVILRQQELSSAITEVQLSLKNEILQAVNTIKDFQPQPVIMQQPMPAMSTPNVEELLNKPPMDNLMDEMPEAPLMENLADEMPEEPVLDDLMIETPLMDMPVEEALVETAVPEAPLMEEPLEEAPLMEDLAMEEPLMEEAPVEETAPEVPIDNTPSMPDMSDPNKMMSPDDIAALIANVSSGGDIPVPESEPVMEEEAEQEEEIPIPDMSDPNKMMSPDDIAALIANL